MYDPDLIITAENRAAVANALGLDPATNLVTLANIYHNGLPRTIDAVTAWAAQHMAAPARQHYRTGIVGRAVRRGDAVMMVGPAGCGKTTIGEHIAQAMCLPMFVTSAINDAHELTGYIDGYGKYHPTPFRHAFENGGVWIADEIDAWDAPALLSANSALANGFAPFPDADTPIRKHENFRAIATANTFGTGADRVYVGRSELDAASLDRFAVITVDYDIDLERMMARGEDAWLDYVWQTRKVVQEKRIRHVVSSRAINMGARALRDGEQWDDVAEMYLLKGMSSQDRSKLNVVPE